jgi:hypothetical protein
MNFPLQINVTEATRWFYEDHLFWIKRGNSIWEKIKEPQEKQERSDVLTNMMTLRQHDEQIENEIKWSKFNKLNFVILFHQSAVEKLELWSRYEMMASNLNTKC